MKYYIKYYFCCLITLSFLFVGSANAIEIFHDDFNRPPFPNNVIGNGWTKTFNQNADVQLRAGNARFPGILWMRDVNASVTHQDSTVGYTNISLNFFWRGTATTESDDHLHLKWFDGSIWTDSGLTLTLDNQVPTLTTFNLPIAAENNPAFEYTFFTHVNAANEAGRLQEVTLSGAYAEPVDCTIQGADGGPFECGSTLNLSATNTPGNEETFTWSSDCGTFDDSTSATPTLTLTNASGCPNNCSIDLTVEEDNVDVYEFSCSVNISVNDTTRPTIICNAPATITPPDAPISFTATATDDCDTPTVQITGYECFAFTKKGKRIDKSESCDVYIGGISPATINILDTGGVGTHIKWHVLATDACGNTDVETCEVLVGNPGRGLGLD